LKGVRHHLHHLHHLLPLLGLAGCIDPVDPRWTLDHDHVIAARATPPRIRAGDATNLDALVAHADGPVTIENPMTAELANAPAEMARSLVHEDGVWRLHAPDAETLAGARPALGLPEDAPVPVDVMMTFSNVSPVVGSRAAMPPFRVKKTVWLGEPSENPAMPPVLVGDVAATDEIVVPIGVDTYLSVDVPDGVRVSWLTNVGELFQDDVPRAFVRVLPDHARSGQLVVVLRDNDGGVAWQVFSMRAE
jgi:hypothetical protein